MFSGCVNRSIQWIRFSKIINAKVKCNACNSTRKSMKAMIKQFRTCTDAFRSTYICLRFTAGYILYNCICDEYKSWIKSAFSRLAEWKLHQPSFPTEHGMCVMMLGADGIGGGELFFCACICPIQLHGNLSFSTHTHTHTHTETHTHTHTHTHRDSKWWQHTHVHKLLNND